VTSAYSPGILHFFQYHELIPTCGPCFLFIVSGDESPALRHSPGRSGLQASVQKRAPELGKDFENGEASHPRSAQLSEVAAHPGSSAQGMIVELQLSSRVGLGVQYVRV